jgi:hypothetical protein
MSSGGGGQQTSETQSSSHLPGFEQPLAKAYLSALAGQVFPGMQIPDSWMPKGWDFNPSASAGGVDGSLGGWDTTAHANNPKWMAKHPNKAAQIQQQLAAQAAAQSQPAAPGTPGNQIATPGLNQNLSTNLMNPILGSSPSLQSAYGQNPGAITSAMSPTSFNQLSQIYSNFGLA